jgi:hypothetical protein
MSSTFCKPDTSGKSKWPLPCFPVGSAEGFQELLEQAAKRLGSKQALATAIGITPGRLSRLLGGEYSMEVINCLRLAKIISRKPDDVLRMAGKDDVADLIVELYGPAPERPAVVDDVVVNALSDAERGAAVRELFDDAETLAWLARAPWLGASSPRSRPAREATRDRTAATRTKSKATPHR